MRLHAIARVREQARAFARKVRRAAVLLALLMLIVVSVLVGKHILLKEVSTGLHKSFAYERLKLSFFPPALVISGVRTLDEPPLLRARNVRIEVPYLSLLRSRKVLSIVLDRPEIRLRKRPAAAAAPTLPPQPRAPLSLLELPFVVESGRIEKGTLTAETGAVTLEVRDIDALVTQKGLDFTARATAAQSGLVMPAGGMTALGGLTVLLAGHGEDLTIDRLEIDGPGLTLLANGTVKNFLDPTVELQARFDIESGVADGTFDLPFDWSGRLRGEGRFERKARRLSFGTSVVSDDLAINTVPMGKVKGRFDFAPETGGQIELGLQKPGRPAEHLTLAFVQGRVEGRVGPAILDPVFREIQIPWPVRSPAWGDFTLAGGLLTAKAEFRDETLERRGDLFAFRGGVETRVDLVHRLVNIDTPGLESDFGKLKAAARIDLRGDLDVRIQGQIADVKEAREFVALAIHQPLDFGEIRGQGYIDAHLTGPTGSPALALKGTLSPGGFDTFDAAFIDADARYAGGAFDGLFDVEDPALKGRVRIKAAGGDLEVAVEHGEFELSKALTSLAIPVALSGRAVGDFRMVQKAGQTQELSGTFTSPEIKGYDQTATRVSGELAWKDGVIRFPDLTMDFYGGRFAGRLAVDTVRGDFDVDARGEELDFGRIVPSALGRLSLSVAGKGVFGRDRLPGLFTVKDLTLSPLSKTEARGSLEVGVVGGRVALSLKGGLVPGDNPFEGAFDFPLSAEPWSGVVKGRITDLDRIMPWNGALGRADFTADIRETPTAARVAVDLVLTASVMPLPGFAYAVTDFTSSLTYLDGVLTFTSLDGKLGGGPLKGSGKVGLAEGGVASMDMTFEGRDMVLSPMARMRAQADATLRILKDPRRFVTEGEILFKRVEWRREVYEPFEFSSQAETEPSGPSFFEGMALNIRLRAEENAVIENSLGRFNVRFNLTVTGPYAEPALLGDIDFISGDMYFQDRNFRVLNGRLSFTDSVSAEPYLDFRGEAYVKDYRVTLNLNGPISRLKPEFTSSPPLPPEEILSLLALGDAFRPMYYSYSGDRSTALNTASLLTYQIADLAKKQTGGLFSLDRFRIDPYIPEGAPGGIAARITVGKKLADNVLVLYSTILANSTVRQEIDEVPIFRMEWDLSRRFSLVGGRDDRGRLGFDVKFHRRF